MAELNDLSAALEAILFVAEEPVPVQEIAEVLEVPPSSVEEGLAALGTRLESTARGWCCGRSPAGGASTPGPTCIPTWNGSPREPLPPVSAGPRWRPLPWWPTASRFPAPRSRRFAGWIPSTPCTPWSGGPGRVVGRPGGRTSRPLRDHRPLPRETGPALACRAAASGRPRPPPGSWSGWRSLSGRGAIERLQRLIAHAGLASGEPPRR